MGQPDVSMLAEQRICFVGAGAMASAMIGGLCEQKLVEPSQLTASDPTTTQLDKLSALYPIHTTTNNLEAVAEQDIIILAIKPQTLPTVGQELYSHIPSNALVLSIIAGATITSISDLLGHDRIVRVIPNTPAQISEGMSAWTRSPSVSEDQAAQAQAILSGLGQEIELQKEAQIDLATAIAGSGPAYVFLILEAMIDAGVQLGFARPVAEQLVLQTVSGSVAYARHSGKHLAELRNQVTSPGGTTAAGLFELEQGGLRTTLAQGISAAYQQSRRLGGLNKHG